MSLLLAQSRHHRVEFQCPLLGVKRTVAPSPMSAFDPKRTFVDGARSHWTALYDTLSGPLNVFCRSQIPDVIAPVSNSRRTLSPLGEAMRRRDLIKGIAGSATGWPLGALAQQSAIPVIGFLSFRSANESAGVEAAFREGLSEIGYSEGRNVHIAFRWAEGQKERLRALAANPG